MENSQPTPTIEDYLSLIYAIQYDHEKISGSKLAEVLGVSAPTVTTTLQRMERDGWILTVNKKQISLTSKGKEAALAVVLRHNLVECLLFETLGMPLSSIHEEAHRIEHAISKETESHLLNKFRDTAFSPFGMPLNGNMEASRNWVPLMQAPQQSALVIRRIIHYDCTRDALQFLQNHQLLPGKMIRLANNQQFNQTITVETLPDQTAIILGYALAKLIQVESIQNQS